MDIKGFKSSDGTIHKYDYGALTNVPQSEETPAAGADGGYYTPVVTQPDDNTLQFDFTPSDPEMPSVKPVQVTLPGQDSGGNVDLTGYATEQYVQNYAQPKGNYLTEVPEGYAKTEDIPTKPEDIGAQPEGDYALRSEIPSVPVESVNGKTGAVSLAAADVKARPDNWMPTASDVGALPSSTVIPTIPTKLSAFTNDSGFITGYTETDPTVPAWAKAASKPSYSKSEVGLDNVDNVKQYSASNPPPYPVTSVNGETGAVMVTVPTKVSAFTNDAGYLTEHQDISGKLDTSALPTAINTALAQAKESGEFDGKTPVKGTDYFTEDDIAEIVEEICETLPDNETLIANVTEQVPIVKVAEPPEFVNDISECTDTSKMYVLSNGHLAAYMTSTVTTEGETVANFTNLYNTANGAYIKDGYRYSSSSAAFKEQTGHCAIVVPIGQSWKNNAEFVLRVRGATQTALEGAYGGYVYGGNDGSTFSYGGNVAGSGSVAGSIVTTGEDIIFTITLNTADNAGSVSWLVVHVASVTDESNLIVTFNEEITYTTTEGSTETVAEWVDTGIEYNQPPDYTDRVAAVEKKTAQLVNDVDVLENRVNNIGSGSASGSGGMDAFAYAAYPPSPQLPGDGSDEADFNVEDVATSEVYAYMDALWSRYRTYMVRQNLGKDSSGEYDYYRYVFSKAYWRAWYKENYPKMFAWINGSTVIYSESVSPRVGDAMYTTPYIGTAYSTVTAVNSETVGTASTRSVNGLVFERYSAGDVEPTIVYTAPFAITADYKGRTYTNAFAASSSVKEFTHDYIIDSEDVKYFRYPFEDRKLNKSRLFSVFILANEHGNKGDSMIPCVTVLRMLKDLCSPTDNLFLKWLKENAVVTVIPLGNPHGGYNNANNVNINRNYDTPGWAGSDTDPAGGTKEEGVFGAYAGSEIETQYIMNTIQQCKAQTAVSYHGRGIPTGTLLGEYNSHGRFQGCGFDPERMWKVEEALFSMYNFGLSPDWHTIVDDSSNNYLNAGKSPSYIEYAGAVGGLIEIDDYEVGTLDCFTPLAMEQAYAEVLLVLQNWVEEALNK